MLQLRRVGVRTAVGPYDISRTLGRGTFGIVFDATNRNDSSRVAMKFEPRGSNGTVIREINLLRTLPEHANIVRFVDAFQIEPKGPHICEMIAAGGTFMVLDYYENDLFGISRLWRSHLNPPTHTSIMRQFLTGLAHIHTHGHLHRDLKLSNILVGINGIVKIADFGQSCPVAIQPADYIMGTYNFTARNISE